jgi:hypothetical protein
LGILFHARELGSPYGDSGHAKIPVDGHDGSRPADN